jgi:2-polyprenyl-3-methyl-5-hydroxy-6-metoxy-1,4-benzoquinol methylase
MNILKNYTNQTKNWPKRSDFFYKKAYLTEFGKYLNDKDLTILDFGCGLGDFLKVLENEGYKNLFGVEIDKSAFKLASSKLKKVKLFNQSGFDFLKNKKNFFDIIFLIDVLEHIEIKKISTLVKYLFNSLKKGGKLIIRTPNAESIFFGSYMRYIDPTHTTSFTRHSIKSLFEDKGFKTIEIRGQKLADIFYLYPLKILRTILELLMKFIMVLYYGELGFKSIQTPNLIAVFEK